LYTGVTNDLAPLQEHKQGLIPGFTQKYRVTRLVYFGEFGDIEMRLPAKSDQRVGTGAEAQTDRGRNVAWAEPGPELVRATTLTPL